MPRLTLRIDFDEDRAIGPGKIKLLELIDRLGSISAAGRQMKMSYRRAWLLIDSMNRSFREPVVASRTGGSHGGGAALTPAGVAIVRHYRAVEAAAMACAANHIDALTRSLAEAPAPLPASEKKKRTPKRKSHRPALSVIE